MVLEKTLESPLDCKEIQPVHSERDQPWDFFGRNDAKAETPVLRLIKIKKTNSSADEWIRKLWYIYTMEYYSAIKKNAFESVLIRQMKLEPIMQSEVSQKENTNTVY